MIPAAALVDAAERWGTPLYVTDLDRAAANLAAWRSAFGDALLAYAVKANADPQLLRRLVAEGAGCEVVTAAELALAVRAGCPPERLVMDGVGKTDADLRSAFTAGALVNVESLEELDAALEIAPRDARIGLRLNPGLDARTHPHLATGSAPAKFGIAWDDLEAGLERLRRAGRPLAALGAHIGSDIADLEPFATLAGRLARAAAVAADAGPPPGAIDLGGGAADADPDRLRALAAAVRSALPSHPLILEPGRSLVADAGVLLVRVIRVQHRGDRALLVADAGMSELLRPVLYGAEHPVRLVASGARLQARDVDLVGPVCEAGDTLAVHLGRWVEPGDLGHAGRGALLAIERAGAYGAVMASTYNGRPRPAEAVLDAAGPRISRRRETVDDLLARDA